MQINGGQGFSGGLNNTNDPSEIQQNECQDVLNWRFNNDGSITKRTGSSKLITSAESSPILAETRVTIGDSRYDLYATKSDIKLKNGLSASSVLSGLNGIDYAQFHQWNDKLFFANGVDNIKKTKVSIGKRIFAMQDNGNVNVFNGNMALAYDIPKPSAAYNSVGAIYPNVYFILTGKFGTIHRFIKASNLYADQNYLTAPYISSYCTDGVYLYIAHDVSGGSKANGIEKATSLLASISTSGDLGYAIRGISCNGINIFVISSADDGETNTLYKYDMSYTLVSSVALSFNPSAICVNSNTGFVVDKTNAILKSFSLSTLATTAISATSGICTDQYSTPSCDLSDVYYYNSVTRNICRLNILSLTVTSNTPFSMLTDGNVFVDVNINISEWYDLCSPFKPIPNILSDAGTPNATCYYRSTWYNTATDMETSGGLESNSCAPSSKKVEVFFDFNLDSQLTYKKADLLLISHHRLYRKEGTNSYLLQGTYPVYFNLKTGSGITSAATSMTVEDIKGMTYTDNFYLIFDDTGEIVLGTGITGSTITMTRGQKGTTAAAHLDSTVIYMFSIIDNIATASLGQVCPVQNDFVPVAKFIDHAQERLLLANSAEYPSRMWYSSYNPDTLRGDEDIILSATVEGQGPNWKDVGINDGSDIEGMKAYINNNVYFLKDRALWYVSGDMSSGSLLKFDGTIGTVSNKSIVEIPGGLLFLSRDGVMFFNGTRLLNISKYKIHPTILSINWDYAYLSHAVFYPKYNEYWLFVPTGSSTTCDKVIVLNILLSDLKTETGPKCYSLFNWAMASSQKTISSDGDTVIWAGDYSGNLLLLDDTDADNTAAINAYIVLKNDGMRQGSGRRSYSLFNNHKTFRRTLTEFKRTGNWNLSMQYSIDGGTYSTAHDINCDTSAKGSIRDYDKFSIDSSGHYITYKYTNASASQSCQIFNVSTYFKEHKVR